MRKAEASQSRTEVSCISSNEVISMCIEPVRGRSSKPFPISIQASQTGWRGLGLMYEMRFSSIHSLNLTKLSFSLEPSFMLYCDLFPQVLKIDCSISDNGLYQSVRFAHRVNNAIIFVNMSISARYIGNTRLSKAL